MRRGLNAMSGVRAHNEELKRMGLTLPGSIERNKKIASLPSLGLLTLAGMTTREIEVDYIEVEDINNQDGLPGSFDVVAISSFSAQIKEAYELADRYRRAGTKVILGGLHVTACPDEAQQHADCVVVGEGEPVWPQLIADLQQGQLKPHYDARGKPFDLSQAPMPRFDLLDPERYNRITVQTSRGCPFDCEFCAASIRLAPQYRVKPVHKVIEEIREIKKHWAKPFIEFADDNSFVNKRHAKELLRELAKEKIRWFTESDLSIARDEELLRLMRDSGCAQVLIGFESPTRSGLKGIERKNDWKAKHYDEYMSAIERIQSHGISVNGCFVMGMDGSGIESFAEVRDFVKQSGLHEVQVTVLTAFPSTPLYQRLKATDRLVDDQAWELCTLFDVNFVPDTMSLQQLEENFRWLISELYSDEATQQRKANFFRQLRGARRGVAHRASA